MRRRALVWAPVVKEVRGLWLAWVSSLVVVILAWPLQPARGLGILAYIVGAVGLGALSIGHEYTHRTLGLLLSQPVSRRRLLAMKVGVLAAMLLTLAAIANVAVFAFNESDQFRVGIWARALPVLCGLFVAPWLTMLCRSALAGMVFSVALPGALWVTLSITLRLGLGVDAPAALFVRLFWWVTLTLCAVAAIAGWRRFMRLEAVDGSGQDLSLPHWLRRRESGRATTLARTRRHPVWLLVKKEIRLQRLPLVAAGVFAAGWLIAISLRLVTPAWQLPANVLAGFSFLTISLLIPATAVAEERHLGTLEWHVLLPLATTTQWVVKVAVALGLVLITVAGLVALVAWVNPAGDLSALASGAFWAVLAATTVGSLYMSSLSRSPLWALLVSLPVFFCAAVFGNAVIEIVGPAVFRFIERTFGPGPGPQRFIPVRGAMHTMSVIALFVAAALVVILLRFGLANYRSAEHSVVRIVKQVAWLAVSVTTAVALLGAVSGLLSLWTIVWRYT